MHLTVDSKVLVHELRQLTKIIPNKPAVVILSHVLLTAAEGKLSFFATDLEVGMRCSCAADIKEEGALVVPAQKLLSMAEHFTVGGEVSIMRDNKQVVVKCGKFTSRLQVLPAEDFPLCPEPAGDEVQLTALVLAQAIDKTRYAISPSGPKYAIQGALLTLKASGALMVATDGKRLALTTLQTESNGKETSFVLPAKTLDMLSSQLAGGNVTMHITKNHLFFQVSDRLLLSRVIDGKFPKYEAFIPKENTKRLTINRAALAAALHRVNQVTDENHAVIFDIEGTELRLSTSSVHVGSADEVLEIKYDGHPLKVCVNGNYVLDFAKAGTLEDMTIALKDHKTAMLLQEGAGTLGMVMLMSL